MGVRSQSGHSLRAFAQGVLRAFAQVVRTAHLQYLHGESASLRLEVVHQLSQSVAPESTDDMQGNPIIVIDERRCSRQRRRRAKRVSRPLKARSGAGVLQSV